MNTVFTMLTLFLLLASKAGLTADIQAVGLSGASFADMATAAEPITLQIKRGQPYDETKDPALRKGTENWEQEQSSFFVIPALLVGIIGLLLFFTRNKGG